MEDLRRIQRGSKTTAVMVTHDQDEAFALADRFGFISFGELVQADPSEEIYARPASAFVAKLVGSGNVFVGEIVEADGDRCLKPGEWVVPFLGAGDTGDHVVANIRPGDVNFDLRKLEARDQAGTPATVHDAKYRGFGWSLSLRSDVGQIVALPVVGARTLSWAATSLPRGRAVPP